MKKSKLTDLQGTIESQLATGRGRLEDIITSSPVNFIGQVFYGRKDVSKKDGSYTATLWYVFCLLPILPIDTFRMVNPAEISKKIFPRVFALDEFIGYETRKISLDYFQVVMTLLGIWTPVIAGLVLLLAFPLYTVIGIITATFALLGFELYKKRKAKLSIAPKAAASIHAGSASKPAEVSAPQPKPQFAKVETAPKPAASPKQLLATFQTMFSPKQDSNAQAVPKPKPKIGVKASPATYVPHLWDDLYGGVSNAKIKEIRKVKQAESDAGSFFEVLGFINFMLFPIYFFLYAYLTSASAASPSTQFLTHIFYFLTTGHLLSIVSIAVGVVVSFKNKTLGFFLILFAAAIMLDYHVLLWNYLNKL